MGGWWDMVGGFTLQKPWGFLKPFSTKVETHGKWGEVCGIAVSCGPGRLSTKTKIHKTPSNWGYTKK